MAIYVPRDSVEAWSSPELFQMDEKLDPKAVAGCPPDAFAADGQLWGNPLYRWDVLAEDGYSWWLRRLGAAGKLYDVVRMDHFRAFAGYWSVPFGDPTARGGKWITGPGIDFINAVKKGLPELKLIAEDLGYLTQDVLDLRDESGYPGMKVLQFAFDSREESDYLPHNYDANCVVYTGTHDNDTMLGWMHTAPQADVRFSKKYLNIRRSAEANWEYIRSAYQSVAALAVIPLQDFLGLGSEARINTPSTLGQNWRWRVSPGSCTEELAARIRDFTALYGRLAK